MIEDGITRLSGNKCVLLLLISSSLQTPPQHRNISDHYICMYVGRKSEMLVFISVFFPTVVIFQRFQWSLGKKQKNVSLYVVCMYVRPKQTFVSLLLTS